MSLAYLVCGPDDYGLFKPEDLGIAVALLLLAAVVWFLVALFFKKNGKPLGLPPLFWILAGVPAAFLLFVLGMSVLAWAGV